MYISRQAQAEIKVGSTVDWARASLSGVIALIAGCSARFVGPGSGP